MPCSPAFKRENDDEQKHLVIIQCDAGNVENDLIACARYRIFDQRFNGSILSKARTHVLFIIHVPVLVTTKVVGFLGDPWVSTHIDDLRAPTDSSPSLDQAMRDPISSLFYRKPEPDMPVAEQITDTPTVTQNLGFCSYLHHCIQAAASRIQAADKQRTTGRLPILTALIPDKPPVSIGEFHFTACYEVTCDAIGPFYFR